ncbi:MAG TPA: glycosyltransferase [Acidobacteria bacterium]|nr:glycosyltransferase [Acidobacteriota bacterium]
MMARVLWASPLPPVRSGVSDYSMELLPHLAGRCDVRVVLPPGVPGAELEGRCTACSFVPVGSQPEPGEVPILHLGNNPYHEWILPMLETGSPVVVLHDLVLHHLLVESTLAHGKEREYGVLLTAAEPEAGPALATARRYGFTGSLDPFLFPAIGPFLETARAAVVHSRWAAERVRQVRTDLPVAVLPMPAEDPGPVANRPALRERLGIADDELALMHVGFLTPAKGLREILGGVAVAWRMGVPVRLVLVGEGEGVERIRSAARAVGIEDRLLVTGWIPSELFLQVPAAADLGVVLRTPSAGETSAAVVRFLACGTPVAVGGLHQFLEWPVEAAPRLTPGPPAEAELARLLERLHREMKEGRAGGRRRAARRAYDEGGHRPERVAKLLADFLESVA